MCKTGKLFRSALTGQQVWDLYLSSFREGDDPIFRDPSSTSHNCNLCNNFIRRYGNIVAIDENLNVMSMFDVIIEGEYENVAKVLTNALKNAAIKEVFFETFDELNKLPYEKITRNHKVFRLGVDKNHKRYTREEAEKYGVVKPNEIVSFDHFYLDLAAEFVNTSGKSVESIMGEFRDAKEVFKRGMEEIPLDTLILVKDLINQGSLLDGTTHLHKIEKIIPFKIAFDNLPGDKKDNWCWITSYKLAFAKFRNELIGVLCTELAEGKELNEACKTWNYRVDPANYMKAIAPFTESMKKKAIADFIALGFQESDLERRFATINDIKASEILHLAANNSKIKEVSVFDSVKATSTRHKRSEFDGIEEVSIDKFMKDILPGCTSVEAFLQNSQEGNMVSLTTEKNKGSKNLFKWDNPYSWTFNGNLAGKSQIKEAVKDAGGRVDGVLRASMIWNESGSDTSDLDLWCIQPNDERIGYSQGFRKDRGDKFSSCGGQLDLDNTNPYNKIGIENIYFKDTNKLKTGVYKFYVNQFSARNSKGFKFEIEFNDEIYTYVYNRPLTHGQNIQIAEVTYSNSKFSIKHILPATEGEGVSKEIYGLETNKFHKVNLVCLSPNHWDENNVGNKHYLFMLEGAKSPISIKGFHIENLIPELAAHRKFLEPLSNSLLIEPSDKQLSGLGFNSSVTDFVILKLSGSFKRTIKVKFN